MPPTSPGTASIAGNARPDPPARDGLSPQLAVDAVLCERLVAGGCAGPEWELFTATLYRRAVRVVYRRLAEGTMFADAARIGRPVTAEDVCRWGEDAVRELAHEIVQETFGLFREQLLSRRYDPHRGATLFTYFMNATTRQFPNVYRRKRKARRSFENLVDLRPSSHELDRADPDDYYAAHARFQAMLLTLVDGITAPQQRHAAWLFLADGQSYRHIAQRLGVTPDAARSLVNRARAAMRDVYLRHVHEGKEDGDD